MAAAASAVSWWRARAWNALGWATMQTGRGLYLAGLHLCGLAGTFDANADSAALGWPRCVTCGYLHPARLGCPDPEWAASVSRIPPGGYRSADPGGAP